jgi:hypothetical protein
MLVLFSIYLLASGCQTSIDCNDHGECLKNQCLCDEQYHTYDCSEPFCVFGDIINGECKCDFGSDLQDGYCTKSCKKGNFSKTTGKCVCYPGWKTSGITDTINWLEGDCSQFECQSDIQCQRLLPNVNHPTCPIKGWNCDCGFFHLKYRNNNAGCMGFMYVLSIYAFRIYRYLCLQVIWKIVISLIVISIPFGRTRPNCDHHRSWLSRFRKWLGCPNRCQGECVRYRGWRVRDDLALSIYWFKSGLWWYTFLTCLGIGFLFTWSLILWIIIIVSLLIVGIMICCMALSSGGGGDGCHNCECLNCECLNCGSDMEHTGYSDNMTNINIFYFGGPSPSPYLYNGGYYYGDCDCCDCGRSGRSGRNGSNSRCCMCLLDPFLFLIRSYPSFPENLHGGLVGYLIGTHPTLNNNDGSSRLNNFLSLNWTRKYDLRNNKKWQTLVRGHLQDNNTIVSPKTLEIKRLFSKISMDVDFDFDLVSDSDKRENIMERYTIVSEIDGVKVFTYEYPVPEMVRVINREHIEPECECWICSTRPSKWMIWSCDHAFCENCSQDMIKRGMPCPLCRMVSTYYRVYNQE